VQERDFQGAESLLFLSIHFGARKNQLHDPRETVVVEKLEAMVKLGIANSRMKDFYDLQVLARTFAFDGENLAEAVQNTFRRRGTELPPGIVLVFTPDFMRIGTKSGNGRLSPRRTRLTSSQLNSKP